MSITWILERGVFASGDAALVDAIRTAGDSLVRWDDGWWTDGRWPRIDGPVVVRASLGNADRIARELPWRPGAFCRTDSFRCSQWYPAAEPWLLHRDWIVTPRADWSPIPWPHCAASARPRASSSGPTAR